MPRQRDGDGERVGRGRLIRRWQRDQAHRCHLPAERIGQVDPGRGVGHARVRVRDAQLQHALEGEIGPARDPRWNRHDRAGARGQGRADVLAAAKRDGQLELRAGGDDGRRARDGRQLGDLRSRAERRIDLDRPCFWCSSPWARTGRRRSALALPQCRIVRTGDSGGPSPLPPSELARCSLRAGEARDRAQRGQNGGNPGETRAPHWARHVMFSVHVIVDDLAGCWSTARALSAAVIDERAVGDHGHDELVASTALVRCRCRRWSS